MALISEKDAQAIRDHFAKHLAGDVKLTYFTQHESKLIVPGQECTYCAQTQELLEAVAALSDKVTLDIHDFVADEPLAREKGIERVPAFTVEGAAKGTLRFFGIPSGYEFTSLIEDIVDVSTGTTSLSAKTKEALAALPADVHIRVFTTPT